MGLFKKYFKIGVDKATDIFIHPPKNKSNLLKQLADAVKSIINRGKPPKTGIK